MTSDKFQHAEAEKYYYKDHKCFTIHNMMFDVVVPLFMSVFFGKFAINNPDLVRNDDVHCWAMIEDGAGPVAMDTVGAKDVTK